MGDVIYLHERSNGLSANARREVKEIDALWRIGGSLLRLAEQKPVLDDPAEQRRAENIAGLGAMVASSQWALGKEVTAGDPEIRDRLYEHGYSVELAKIKRDIEEETAEPVRDEVFAAAWNMCKEITGSIPPTRE